MIQRGAQPFDHLERYIGDTPIFKRQNGPVTGYVKVTPLHSCDPASLSILATQPASRACRRYDSNGSKAGSETQIKERRLEVKISDDPKKAQDGKNAGKPPDTTLQTVLTNSGMKNVGNPPSEADLKTYYSKNGPAHELIAKGSYHEAADEYRKLANKATGPEQTRLKTVASQLEVAQEMKTANVKSLQFPPTETNVTDYFKTMKGKSISDIKDAFENYANAFYVHSEENGVDRGDVVYSEHKYKEGNKVYTSNAPVSWKEVTDDREVHSDGRRIIDCEGYAYMGQKSLKAAGFENVNFGVTARNPNTPKSLTIAHHGERKSHHHEGWKAKNGNGDYFKQRLWLCK